MALPVLPADALVSPAGPAAQPAGPAALGRVAAVATLTIACLAGGVLVAVPVVRLVQISAGAGFGSLARVLDRPGLGAAIGHSLLLAAVVPLGAVPLGGALALGIRRFAPRPRALLTATVLLPLIVPPFVLGYSWTQAYARGGFLDSWLGVHWAGLTGPVGVIAVLVVTAAPLSFLLTTAGLRIRARPDLESAARCSGAGPVVVLRTITLPLLRPVWLAAGLLTSLSALEAFAVPQVLGAPAGFTTITTRIYADLTRASTAAAFTDAVTLALGLVVLALLLLVPVELMLAPGRRTVATGQAVGLAPLPGRAPWPARLALTVGVVGYPAVAVGLPLLALVAASITRAVGLPPTPDNWTWANFAAALTGPTWTALGHTLTAAALAALILTVLGAAITIVDHRRSGRALGALTTLTFVLPGSTLAVGLLIAYGRLLGGGLAIILVAYLAKFWAMSYRTVAAAAARVPPDEMHAARASGARPGAALATVWLPALAPALVGAWLIVFVTALHEVTMSSLLASTGNQTLAVVVLNDQETGGIGPTAALSVVLTGILLVGGLLAWWAARAARAPVDPIGAPR